MSGTYTFGLTREEFVAAYWFYTRWLWLWRRMAIAFAITWLIYALLFVAIDFFDGSFDAANAHYYFEYGGIGSVVVAISLIAITLMTFPRRLKRMYDELHVAGRETRFDFGDDGIRSSNRDGTGNFAWSRFKHWIENDQFLLLVLTRFSFIVVVKTKVADDVMADLRAAAVAGGVAKR